MSLHRSKARTLTHAAQIAALLSLAILGVVIMAPRDRVEAPTVEQHDSQPEINTQTTTAAPTVRTSDWTMLAASFEQIREPVASQTASTNGPDETTDEETVAANTDEPRPNPAPPGWQYVGYARTSADRIAALVMINNKQQFVREGITLEGFSIADVTTSHLLLERDGRRFEVKRAEPAPFDPQSSTADARARASGQAARGRTARFEQEQMQQLEDARRRRALETGEVLPDQPLPERPQ